MKTFKIKGNPLHYEICFGKDEILIRTDKWGLGQDVWNQKCPKSELSKDTTIQTAFGWRAWPAMRMTAIYFVLGVFFIHQINNWVNYIGYSFLILMVISGTQFVMKLTRTEWVNIIRKNGTKVAGVAFTPRQEALKTEFLKAYESYMENSNDGMAEPDGAGNVASRRA